MEKKKALFYLPFNGIVNGMYFKGYKLGVEGQDLLLYRGPLDVAVDSYCKQFGRKKADFKLIKLFM